MGDGVELRTTADKGEGVFATRIFPIGETVMVGRIDSELDHNHSRASQVSEHRFVLHGGLIPKVNHSCEPNCGIHLNSSGAHDLIARQRIAPNEEITFDYAMRNYVVEHFPADCRCGSRRCRGRISGWRDLSAQRKADYHGYVAPYLIDIDNRRPRADPPDQTSAGRGRAVRRSGVGAVSPAEDRQRDAGAWHEVRDVVRDLIDLTRRPAPYPVLYLRCGDCGKVAPRTSVRHHAGWCPLCDAYSPRVVGDQVDPGDPDVETVAMTCTARFGCFQFWRRCDNTFTAPAAATVVRCTACGERYPAFEEHRND
jgi:hypothetical protein